MCDKGSKSSSLRAISSGSVKSCISIFSPSSSLLPSSPFSSVSFLAWLSFSFFIRSDRADGEAAGACPILASVHCGACGSEYLLRFTVLDEDFEFRWRSTNIIAPETSPPSGSAIGYPGRISPKNIY